MTFDDMILKGLQSLQGKKKKKTEAEKVPSKGETKKPSMYLGTEKGQLEELEKSETPGKGSSRKKRTNAMPAAYKGIRTVKKVSMT